MVIRYTCRKCKSVLKISDDLAGTDGKCPRCKVGFKVPEPIPEVDEAAEDIDQPDPTVDVAERVRTEDDAAEPEFTEAFADLVDMPMELTPPVDLSAMDEFDSMAGHEPANAALAQASVTAAPEAPKPSVAELMRAHEEAKKKKGAAKKKDKGSLEGAAAAADVMTAGTAASALTRTYDKKRSGGSESPTLTRDERRQVAQRDALVTYAKKAIPALAGLLVCGYFVFSWAFSVPLPDLVNVTGVVTRDGAPLAGAMVQFAPTAAADGAQLENATPSTGVTDADGNFMMMYDPVNPGVLPGDHMVSISTVSGLTYPLPSKDQKKTVSSDARVFNFSL
ncbi:MAG: carboxypeptidase regulatory-like domain-containing protein [Fuerstiella sp.]|nr:carboxypeptidase regulatory-like domain-containing protein [Fuerstiella sp.]MCP4783423.1 carboxypeptidase regulatory-like domain-containing protein [Fuerstiella sp.]MCP4853789.1 carboxypeptidase regulatory-like domain-containing protein [Fuerstiella sp.]